MPNGIAGVGYGEGDVERQLSRLRQAGVTPVYVIPPDLGLTPHLFLLEQQGIVEHLLAFNDPDVDTIYLLSDGSPTVGEQSIPEIITYKLDQWNRNRRVIINCIGFFPGQAQNQNKAEARTFLRNLAHKNEGFYKEIY